MYIEEWILEKLLKEEWERRQGYLYMPYVQIPFRHVESERFRMTEQELKAYEMPITKIIEDNSVKDFQRQVDQKLVEEFYDLFFEEK